MGHRIFVGKDNHKFSAAHMTVFPDGTKERLHGHNFQVSVSVDLVSAELESLVDLGAIKQGMVSVCERWDQRLLLARDCPRFRIVRHEAAEIEFVLCDRRYVVPADEVVLLPCTNVVVETLAEAFANTLKAQLGNLLTPNRVKGLSVTITESPGQGATFQM